MLLFVLDVRGNTQIKGTGDDKDTNVGKETKIKVVKNKVAPPFKEAFVEIIYGENISKTGELIKIATDLDIIKKAGAWYSYNDEKIGQGSENAKKYLADHPEASERITRAVVRGGNQLENESMRGAGSHGPDAHVFPQLPGLTS